MAPKGLTLCLQSETNFNIISTVLCSQSILFAWDFLTNISYAFVISPIINHGYTAFFLEPEWTGEWKNKYMKVENKCSYIPLDLIRPCVF